MPGKCLGSEHTLEPGSFRQNSYPCNRHSNRHIYRQFQVMARTKFRSIRPNDQSPLCIYIIESIKDSKVLMLVYKNAASSKLLRNNKWNQGTIGGHCQATAICEMVTVVAVSMLSPYSGGDGHQHRHQRSNWAIVIIIIVVP